MQKHTRQRLHHGGPVSGIDGLGHRREPDADPAALHTRELVR